MENRKVFPDWDYMPSLWAFGIPGPNYGLNFLCLCLVNSSSFSNTNNSIKS